MKTFFNKKYLNKISYKFNKKYFSEIPKRKDYKMLDDKDKDFFKSFLDENSIETDNLAYYNTDWLKKYIGKSSLVLKPKTTIEVSKILKYCSENNLALVPQSGNTGLVGGSVAVYDEIVLSLRKLDKIIKYNKEAETIETESGVTLQRLNNYLEHYDKTMPFDLGAKGSCLIGGNLATHAGGINFIKHGPLRYNCKSLEVVLANGSILTLDDMRNDLKQLFIGSEGTLGVITRCEIYCKELLKFKNVALVGVNNFKTLISYYKRAREWFRNDLSAIEYFDKDCLDLIQNHFDMNRPFYHEYPLYMLIEVSTNHEDNLHYLLSFLDQLELEAQGNELVISTSNTQMTDLWKYRERISEASAMGGICLKYDISMSLEYFDSFVKDVQGKIGQLAKVIGYGHIGDYNLHLNVCYDKFVKDEDYNTIENILEPYIFDKLKQLNGSISAEHGIGFAKPKYLDRSQSAENICLMKNLKQTLDPSGILNPYKLFYN
jgi:FAD/FMN-containing dehydrogenase